MPMITPTRREAHAVGDNQTHDPTVVRAERDADDDATWSFC
jgi:hypothetical protein